MATKPGTKNFSGPIFFMDLKNADKVELNALARRHKYLQQVAADKNCFADPNEWATKP